MANIHPGPELYSKCPDIDDSFPKNSTVEPYLDEADDAAAENPTRYTGEEVFSRARRRIHGE